jgi:hypothetical protein
MAAQAIHKSNTGFSPGGGFRIWLESFRSLLEGAAGGCAKLRTRQPAMGQFELACMMKLLLHGFDNQTDQRVGASVCDKNQMKTQRIRTNKHNWAS